MAPSLRLLLALAIPLASSLTACSGDPSGGATISPKLRLDQESKPATISATATRQLVSVDVTTTLSSLFGETLTQIHYALDLSAVSNDDPSKYDIALVAACAKEITLSFVLGGQTNAEAAGSEQQSYHQLSIDGCLVQPSALELRGQTNLHKLDDQHVEMTVFFKLTSPLQGSAAESHELTIEDLSLAF